MGEIVFAPDAGEEDLEARLAQSESAKMAEGNLDKDGKHKEHNRHQRFRDHVNNAALTLFWSVSLCVLFGLLSFAYHLLTPASWHWLSPGQLDKLQTLLGAALLSSALTQYTNKRMA